MGDGVGAGADLAGRAPHTGGDGSTPVAVVIRQVFGAGAFSRVYPRKILLLTFFLVLINLANLKSFVLRIPYVEDDAYYYIIIARNIADKFLSTFDGQVLTNGYHPVWMLLLVLQEIILGNSFVVMYLLEMILLTASLYVLLGSLHKESLLTWASFTVLFCIAVSSFALNGMETSILVFFSSSLISYIASANPNTIAKAGVVGLLASACIGARIDAAVFVLPIIILALPTFRLRAVALSIIGALGICYVGFNLAVFGIPMPISGSIKSLGGLQLNTAVLVQLARTWQEGNLVKLIYDVIADPYHQTLILFAGSPLVFVVGSRNFLGRVLIASFIVGCLFYFAKILFFSSWKLWSWYSFPVFFGVLGYTHALAPLARQSGTRYASFVSAFILFGATLFYFVEFVRPQLRLERVPNFHVINGLAAQRFAPILGGARVAMGDRAGSFAFAYDGPVTQLEGLVNDTEYLRVLSRRGDLKSLLCARHVDYILDYETDLGKYEYHEIKILRPSLTTFNGPTLTVRVTDEVERFYDLGKFDDGKSVERDVYLYLWRLEGC